MINCFLSAICVIKEDSDSIEKITESLGSYISNIVSDYELILIDNSGKNINSKFYEQITSKNGYPNIQIFVLTKTVNMNIASWVGLENSLGDYVITIDDQENKIDIISAMLNEAISTSDVVFASNLYKSKQSKAYSIFEKLFMIFFRYLHEVDSSYNSPKYRLLSRRVVNFILQHPRPSITYRHLPLFGGFKKNILHIIKNQNNLIQNHY